MKFEKFHFGFRWSDKRSFSIFVEDKKLFVRRTAGLSLLSLGWERKEKSKFSDGTERQATLEFNEVVSVANDLGKMRAEHFSVKFLLIDPNEVRAQRGKENL